MPEKRWSYKPTPSTESVVELSQAINVDKALAAMLVQRGITAFDDARDFFRPQLSHLHDPFLMPDMEKAVTRLREAIENGEKIMVYGDYDVDGTTAVALVYGFLSTFYGNLEYYIFELESLSNLFPLTFLKKFRTFLQSKGPLNPLSYFL